MNNRKNQVTLVVDKKQGALGQVLFDLITEKEYVVNILTPEQKSDNPKITSENKVIYLAASKLYNNVRKYTEPINEQYGMEYGWRGNTCFVGVDSKKFKIGDKEEIVKLFPEKIQLKVSKQGKVINKDKDKENQNKYNKFYDFVKDITTFSIVSKPTLGLGTVITKGVPYYTFNKAIDYKNKTDLKKHMELANIYNFVNSGLDNFMERE